MKRTTILLAIAMALSLRSAFAGETYTSVDTTPPPPSCFGNGWYAGFHLGVNAYQDFGGTRRFISVGGDELVVDPNENMGFIGGMKLGYVFGTGSVRPAIEADAFYNGVKADLDARLNGVDLPFNADANLNSGAFLANFLLRFGCGQFQPYFGGGLGGYYSDISDLDVTVAGFDFTGAAGDNNSGFAWQLIGGADYYFNEKVSFFGEYKFLNYEDPDIITVKDRISQHLFAAGIRWHF